ncbi:MAG TPA: SDR family NAD(P)-dependent oxidoreductase, partial [Acidobacteria bacterium]|nr:SDR family NAD(P)-dependent oxidoreductase [Acidobacteriota bacterium]
MVAPGRDRQDRALLPGRREGHPRPVRLRQAEPLRPRLPFRRQAPQGGGGLVGAPERHDPLARLPRRPWVVTGANGLLTSAIARELDRRCPLLLCHHRSSDRLDGLHRHPRLAADLASTADRDALVARAAAMAPLGGLVFGASRFERTAEGDGASVRAALTLDLEAPLELALRLAPHMASGARIVLFGDAGTALGWPSYPAYLAAKGGIEAAA